MRCRAPVVALAAIACALGSVATVTGADVDSGVIHLRSQASAPESEPETERVQIEEPRRGFDYDAFQTRLESLWFQRKTFLLDGRGDDAALQLEKIRSFSSEEGVKRLEHVAGALTAEAGRYLGEGNHDRALSALHFAENFDPDDPRIHLLRARIYWSADRRLASAAVELLAALRASLVQSLNELSLFHRLAFVLGLSLGGAVLVFSLLMLLRYQVPFRHEVEECLGPFVGLRWVSVLGWAAITLPLALWVGAGWAAVYWMVVTFRFMGRGERLTAVASLLAVALALPAYRITVAVYGTAADPAVRTTLASVGGEYDPDRIVKLRQLVGSHPDDPVYRFLLAGMYKNGRYFEESFETYRELLNVDPTLFEAHVNIGNIFYTTGQHAEAIANYRRALELRPDSVLAYFNMHLAQSEGFRFGAAEQSLAAAGKIDANEVAELLSAADGWGDRPAVKDASLEMASIWDAALGLGSPFGTSDASRGPAGLGWLASLVNPVGVVAFLALVGCLLAVVLTRQHAPARRCIRCGRPFCHRCKSGREAQEYCSQCLHLFVLGDGLAPGTKSKKLYEVERHDRRARRTAKLAALVLPGAGHVLRGKTGWGFLLLLAWFAALVTAQPATFDRIGRLAGLSLQPDVLLGASIGSAPLNTSPLGLAALATLPVLWILGNVWRWKRREV